MSTKSLPDMNTAPDGRPVTQQRKAVPIIFASHHKTGSNFLLKLLGVIAARRWLPTELLPVRPWHRKLPLSQVLSQFKHPSQCLFDIWFEHEVDVPADGIRLVHMVRDPVKWIRSAYLYHRKGGPTEYISWLTWRVFTLGDKQLSYQELLGELDDKLGILIEAVRSYPEIIGAARAMASSAHILMRRQLTLEQFESNFDASVRSVCEIAGLDPEKTEVVVRDMAAHDLSRGNGSALAENVTRDDAQAPVLEHYLLGDPQFRRLYTEPAQKMGFALDGTSIRSESLLSDSLISEVLDVSAALLIPARSTQAEKILQSDQSAKVWLALALQDFGQGGHLIMHHFIQRIIGGLQVSDSGGPAGFTQ